MIKVLTIFLLLLVSTAGRAQHTLVKIWESDTSLAVPESVLYYKDSLYVSLVDGEAWDIDGKGGIAKLDKNGKIINAYWVTGLNAPKGMGIWDKRLFVADVSEVIVINILTGKIESKISVEGATGLNDITIDSKGSIYVSDSRLGNIHQIKNGKAHLYLQNLQGVNGLKAVDNELYILTDNNVLKTSPDKKLVSIAKIELGGDGIEPVGNGDFIVSCWPGLIYYLDRFGKIQTLLDTREQKKSTADIGYDPVQQIVYVPTLFNNQVVAYKLK